LVAVFDRKYYACSLGYQSEYDNNTMSFFSEQDDDYDLFNMLSSHLETILDDDDLKPAAAY
jgi:hypothetical protein